MKINDLLYLKYNTSSYIPGKETKNVENPDQWQENEKLDPNSTPKWDLERIPLKIFINKCNHPKFLPGFYKAIESAFQLWSISSANKFKFIPVNNENDADINIFWSEFTTNGRDFEAGHNNLKVVNNKIRKAEITIIIFPVIDENFTPVARIERVRRTALHEIGHSLGLNHSNSPNDIMFHRAINNKTLSSNDIRRLNELYNF